jgi:hypothetical protein
MLLDRAQSWLYRVHAAITLARLQYASDVPRMGRLVGCAQLELSSRWREQERQRGEPLTRRGDHLRFPPPPFTLAVTSLT